MNDLHSSRHTLNLCNFRPTGHCHQPCQQFLSGLWTCFVPFNCIVCQQGDAHSCSYQRITRTGRVWWMRISSSSRDVVPCTTSDSIGKYSRETASSTLACVFAATRSSGLKPVMELEMRYWVKIRPSLALGLCHTCESDVIVLGPPMRSGTQTACGRLALSRIVKQRACQASVSTSTAVNNTSN
ncbi:hypothetical protein BKA81DRAFT_138912 [Phyllosticta paracitricarpa]